MDYEFYSEKLEPKTVRWWRDPRKVVVLCDGLKKVKAVKTGRISGLFSALVFEESWERPEPEPEIGVRYKGKRTQKFLGRKLINPLRKASYWPGWPGTGVINLP